MLWFLQDNIVRFFRQYIQCIQYRNVHAGTGTDGSDTL